MYQHSDYKQPVFTGRRISDCQMQALYLPRELTVVMITAVCIPPDSNANSAIRVLHANISNKQSMYPDAVQILAGDFLPC